jgi:hypothetical protein
MLPACATVAIGSSQKNEAACSEGFCTRVLYVRSSTPTGSGINRAITKVQKIYSTVLNVAQNGCFLLVFG